MRKYFSLLAILVLAGFTSAANHYVRQGASGNGSDWANAYGELPLVLRRGDAYYIADGSYPGYKFDDMGGDVVTVKKATVADHGTSTGWQNSYGDGRAQFGSFTISTSNIVIDGQTGGGPGQWTQGHGFYIYSGGRGIQSLNGSGRNITIRHLEIEGHGPDDAAGHNDGIYILGPSADWHLSYLYVHDHGRLHMLPQRVDNVTIEYSCFARNESTPAQHAESIAVQGGNNFIIRYNYFMDTQGTAVIALKKNSDAWTNNNFQVYGNVFYQTPGGDGSAAHGILGDTSGGVAYSSNIKVYNNTIVNMDGLNCGVNLYLGTGNEAYNNLWYKNHCLIGFRNTSHDYNWYYDNWRRNRTPAIYLDDNLVADEAHAQKGTGDPFVDWQNGNFALAAPTDAGKTLNAPFDKDMFGNTRGADGTWDRGAIELNGGSLVEKPAVTPSGGTYSSPISVTITCATSGADIYYTLDTTTPTESSFPYSSPISISTTATLKVRAFKAGLNPSPIAITEYTIAGTQGETIIIEAESMALANGYLIDQASMASQGIMVDPAQTVPATGTATKTFPGVAGEYAIIFHAVPENDGQPVIKLYIDGTRVLEETYPVQTSYFDPMYARYEYNLSGITIACGAEIKIEGTSDNLAYARVDKIEFTLTRSVAIRKHEYPVPNILAAGIPNPMDIETAGQMLKGCSILNLQGLKVDVGQLEPGIYFVQSNDNLIHVRTVVIK